MATRKEIVKTCDVCQKRVTDEGEIHYGGHPHAGWFKISMHGGPTDLRSLQHQMEWDVCSKKCYLKLAEQFPR